MRRPFPLAHLVPDELRGVLLDFHWDVRRLHALPDLPTARVPAADLAWHLDLPFWSAGGKPFQVAPRRVAAEPDTYAEQYARTLAADLAHPVHATERGGRLTVLDGVHRLLKAHLTGVDTLTVRVVGPAHFDAIAWGGDEGEA